MPSVHRSVTSIIYFASPELTDMRAVRGEEGRSEVIKIWHVCGLLELDYCY